jgi:hypothetical protein
VDLVLDPLNSFFDCYEDESYCRRGTDGKEGSPGFSLPSSQASQPEGEEEPASVAQNDDASQASSPKSDDKVESKTAKTKRKPKQYKPTPFGQPCVLMIMSAIMWSMWFVGLLLASVGLKWTTFAPASYFWLFSWFKMLRKPPDPYSLIVTLLSLATLATAYQELASLLGTFAAITGALAALGTIAVTPAMFHWLFPLRQRKRRLLLLGLMAALTKIDGLPQVHLQSEKQLKRRLRHAKGKNGRLLMAKLTPEDAAAVRSIVTKLPGGLVQAEDAVYVIIDTGCSRTMTGFKDDFVGPLVPLEKPIKMDGIGGALEAMHEGPVVYEAISDDGELVQLKTTALYIPHFQCRLLSPQDYLAQQGITDEQAFFTVFSNKSVFMLPNGKSLTISYEHVTRLPIVRCFHDAIKTAEGLAMPCVTDERNQNLTTLQKLLLQWHFKLGHLGFGAVQWIGRQGWPGKSGEKMGKTSVSAPKCAACQFGKQERRPKAGSTVTAKDKGILKQEKLEPGDLVFTDQYESRVPGRVFGNRGSKITSQTYCGGMIFCNAATDKIWISHQVSLNAAETITSKMKIEQEAAALGYTIKAYRMDNDGIYTSKGFMDHLAQSGQAITHSGVGGHHHNGVAENAIKNVVRMARTMMIHAVLRWPDAYQKELWPMAMSHAVYLHNHTPSQSSGLSPEELWTKSKSSHSALQQAHPWGCPVYVLDPKLQDGHKLPKWQPRSRHAQYLGNSPLHASTVGLV